jgi:hypothetical protein
VAAVCARYWRTVLLMIMISLLIFTVLGLIAGLHDMQHLVPHQATFALSTMRRSRSS